MMRALALAVALGCLAAGSAAAMPFGRADRNNDGLVDHPEADRAFPAITESQFTRMDLNGDGLLNRGEYQQLLNIYQLLIRAQ
jgi:hypothetical protein